MRSLLPLLLLSLPLLLLAVTVNTTTAARYTPPAQATSAQWLAV